MPNKKTCQNCKNEFRIDPEDFAFYEKMRVPVPTLCPDCRYQRRLANRNEWNFYKRDCGLCGKSITALYNEEFSGPVYCQSCWWGDGWDPYSYAQEFDFSRPFFEQFHEFRLKVPRVAMANWNSVNSEYTNQSFDNKNCYMCVTTCHSENCLYGYGCDKIRESLDCYNVIQSELMYEALNCIKCSNSAYLEDCADCTSSYFLNDCRGCTSCFGSYGLRNKLYCWKNEQLSKEEYEKRIAAFAFSHENIKGEKEALTRLARQYPHKYFRGHNTINSVGDYIHDVRNAYKVFRSWEAENLRYCQDVEYAKDCLDCTEAWTELSYETEGVEGKSCIAITKSVALFDVSYSELCSNSHDLFACLGLKKSQYCIFNRPYGKTEYHAMAQKIIAYMRKTGEWGEFFPARPSLFGYNESVAQDYFPLSEQEVVARGFRWYHRPKRDYKISMNSGDIPQTIQEIDDHILQETIGCVSQESIENKNKYLNCTTAFRITEAELGLYRKMNIPIPQKCSPCRRQDRMEMRNPRKLWKRTCQCSGEKSSNGIYANISKHVHGASPCPNEFETSYAPDRPEIVYCEQCYQAEIT